jgi:hypothetical protein
MHSKQPYAIYLRRGLLLVNVGNWGSRGKLRHYLPVLPGCCQIQLSRKVSRMHLERRFNLQDDFSTVLLAQISDEKNTSQ